MVIIMVDWYKSNKKTFVLTNVAVKNVLLMLHQYHRENMYLETDDKQVPIGGNFYQNRSGKINMARFKYDHTNRYYIRQLQVGSNIKNSLDMVRDVYSIIEKYATKLDKKVVSKTSHKKLTIDYDIHSNFCTFTLYLD